MNRVYTTFNPELPTALSELPGQSETRWGIGERHALAKTKTPQPKLRGRGEFDGAPAITKSSRLPRRRAGDFDDGPAKITLPRLRGICAGDFEDAPANFAASWRIRRRGVSELAAPSNPKTSA